MKKMMATHFAEIRNMRKLDSRTSADFKESEAELTEKYSEEETIGILSKKKGEWAYDRNESAYESYHEEEDESGSDRESGSSGK